MIISFLTVPTTCRYPGDTYAGGNPWQLLTAAHAELFYLGAEAAARRATAGEVRPQEDIVSIVVFQTTLDADQKAWCSVLGLGEDTTQAQLARRSLSAGDSVMTRLWQHVKVTGQLLWEKIIFVPE